MTPFVAELIGTLFLILLGNGVVANALLKNTKGHGAGFLAITTAWGFAVFVGVLIAAPYSGAHLNPAVTLSLAIIGKFPWSSVISYIIAQLVGAACGQFLVWLFYYDHYTNTTDQGAKLATFCTIPAIKHLSLNFFSEVIGTFALIFSIFYIMGASFKDIATSENVNIGLGALGALPVAIIVWVIGLALGGTTGYAINPARDLAPRLMHQILPVQGKGPSNWWYAWVPIIGPMTGAVIASFLYLWLKQ